MSSQPVLLTAKAVPSKNVGSQTPDEMSAAIQPSELLREEVGVCLVVPWINERKAIVKNITRGFEQLSIQYLASFLESKGVSDIDLFNAQLLELDTDELIESICRGRSYDLIGISCPAQRLYPSASEIVRKLRASGVTSHLVMGGWFATVAHERILEELPELDSVARGEGEFILLDLINNLDDVSAVPGLSHRSGSDIVINPAKPRIHDLDVLPFPDRSDLPAVFDSFARNEYYAHVMGTRGCYANCSFCSINSLFSAAGRTHRSPTNIVDELELLVSESGITNFQFIDEIFLDRSPVAQRWATSICEEILDRGLDINFFIYCRSTDITVEMFELLKNAGLIMVFVGVESGSQAGLDRFNKRTTVADNTEGLRILRELGIKAQIGFIMIDPGADFDEIKDNYRWLIENKVYVANNFTNQLNLYYGTPILDRYVADGLADPSASIANRHSYTFKDPQVDTFAQIVSNLKDLMYPFEEAFYHFKLARRQLRADVRPEGRERISWFDDLLNAVMSREVTLWAEIIGVAIAHVDCGGDYAGAESLFSALEKDREQLKLVLEDFLRDPRPPDLSVVGVIDGDASTHYINESLP